MQKLIFVEPAKGLLVAYESHRPGQYIGVRHARAGEGPDLIVAEAFEGHAYVKAEPPFARVADSPYYQRHIIDGSLKQVSDEQAAKVIAALAKQHADAVKTAPKSAPSDAKEQG